jgi:hypothetical protein
VTEPLALEPDPFDKVVEAVLNDPDVRASLDEQDVLFERGELKTYTTDEVRAKLKERGVPLVDDEPASDW